MVRLSSQDRLVVGGRGIAWAEAVSFELYACCLLSQLAYGVRVHVYGDKRFIVDGWKHRRSRDVHANELAYARLLAICEERDADVSVHHVASTTNPADRPSRGLPLLNPYLHPPTRV